MARKIFTLWVCAIMIASGFAAIVMDYDAVGGDAATEPDELLQGDIFNPAYEDIQGSGQWPTLKSEGSLEEVPEGYWPESDKQIMGLSSAGYEDALPRNQGGWNYEPGLAPWGNWSFRDAHNVPAAAQMGYTGQGVKVAVADTGIDFGVHNLAGKYMTVEDPTSPYYGWPMAFDAYGLPEFLLEREARPGMGGIANTAIHGSGPFDIDRTIIVDGQNDFLRDEQIATDRYDDIKTPGTATGSEFDLTELWAARDSEFWYAGLKTRYGEMNRTFGFALDFDGPASGSINDPHGNLLDFEASHSAPIEHVSFNYPLNLVATCSGSGYGDAFTNGFESNSVNIWSLDGDLIRSLQNEPTAVTSVAWSPDGSAIAYQTTRQLILFETAGWTESRRITHSLFDGPGYREALAFSPDGNKLVAGSLCTSEILVYDMTSGIHSTYPLQQTARSVSFSPDGSKIAVGLSGGIIQILDSVNYNELFSFIAPGIVDVDSRPVETVVWNSVGTQFATGRDGVGTMDIWDLTVADNRFQWGGESSSIMGVELSNRPNVDRFYMRAIPDEITANGLTAYKLGLDGTTGDIQFAPVMEKGGTHSWGMRVWKRSAAGVETEITGGTPEAIVSRDIDGNGPQVSLWVPPQTPMDLTDSIVVRVYQGRNIIAPFIPTNLVSEYITPPLNSIQLNSTVWEVCYFTRRNSTDGALKTRLIGHEGTVHTIIWDGTRMVSGAMDGKVIFRNPTTFAVTSTRNTRYNTPVLSLAAAWDSMFVGSMDCTVRRYPSDWSSYVPFAAHKPDIMIYVRYEREYYIQTAQGRILETIGRIEEPDVYKWMPSNATWMKTSLESISGKSSYRGYLAEQWTAHGFIELALPRAFTSWPDQYELHLTAFSCGDFASRPQDTVPSDCNVPSQVGRMVDWTGTHRTTLGAWGKVEIPHVTVNHAEIQGISGTYHFGNHPSALLTNLFGSVVPIIVAESATAGTWDRVYADMNMDHVIDSNDPYVDRNNPVLTLDIWDSSGASIVPGQDGIPDLSGGMLYYIADGVNLLPYSQRAGEILLENGRLLMPFGSYENPWNIPGNGEVVAFFGDFEFDSNQGRALTSGTQIASAIAGDGFTQGEFSPIQGVSPDVRFLPICNAHRDLLMALNFAIEGYDMIPNSGDDAHIVAVGSYTTGYGSGLDPLSLAVESLVSRSGNRAVFVSPSGNEGSGYGTVAAPCGMNTLVVGFTSDNTFISGGGNVHHQGAISELSSRGPTAAGIPKPDAVALGMGNVDLPLGTSGSLATSVGGVISQTTIWHGSELAMSVAAGVMSLIFQAYKDKYGNYPSTQAAMDIMRSSAKDLGYDPMTQGSGFLDALAAVKAAKGMAGLVTSAQSTSFGDTFGMSYESFINVLAPGQNGTLPISVQNPTTTSMTTNYGLEQMALIDSNEFIETVDRSAGFKGDISHLIPLSAEMVKVTAQTDFTWFEGSEQKWFPSEQGSFFMKLLDWVDAQPSGQAGHGIIDGGDDLSYLTGVEYGYVNSMICTLSNPHGSLAGKLVVQVQPDWYSGTMKSRPWKFTVESFAAAPPEWLSTSKSSAFIWDGNTDTVDVLANVPADAQTGTYTGALVATYAPANAWTNVTQLPVTVPEKEYENIFLRTTSWDDGSQGNYWSDYQAKYPAAVNDGTVWDTPYEFNTPGKRDNYPLVNQVNTRFSKPPISISDNAQFPLHSTTGDGSVGNPWLIENLIIHGGAGKGIEITGTDDYFMIMGCEIYNMGSSGIYMDNVMNGVITGCEIHDNGIDGISVFNTANVLIDGNIVMNNGGHGINAISVTNLNINGNEIYGNDFYDSYSFYGINLETSDGNRMTGNELYGNGFFAILMSGNNNVIDGNYIHDELEGLGIFDFGTGLDGNVVTSNKFQDFSPDWSDPSFPMYLTIWISGATNTIISGNDFIDCDGGVDAVHVVDDSADTTCTGNYWSNDPNMDGTPFLAIDSDYDSVADVADTSPASAPVSVMRSHHTPIAPITISGDGDFAISPGVVGGSGTVNDPYIISGWEIDSTGFSNGIYIENTNAHFVIMGCLMHGDPAGTGIRLSNAFNGKIIFNTLHSLGNAVTVQSGSSTKISHNHFYMNTVGIFLDSTYLCHVSGNRISLASDAGIWNHQSIGSIIQENIVADCPGDGILLSASSDCDMAFNILSFNGYGIHLANATGFNTLHHNNFLGNTVQAYDDFIGETLDSFFLPENFSLYNVNHCNITKNGAYLAHGIDYIVDFDSGLITFTPPISQGHVIIRASLIIEEYTQPLVRLPYTRLTDAPVSIIATVIKLDGSVVQVPVSYELFRKVGIINLLDQCRVERGITIIVEYAYYSGVSITPLSLNVMAPSFSSFQLGDMSTAAAPGVMPVWGLRAGQGASLDSGDRRYFYMNVPNQGLFGDLQLASYYLYTELEWALANSDINVAIYGMDGEQTYPIAPYTMKELASSGDDSRFWPSTITGGPKEILVTPLQSGIITICLSSKTFHGSGGSVNRFEGRGGWIKFSDRNPTTWSNDLGGNLELSLQSSIGLDTGLFASVVGPAISERTTEDIYQDELSLYDLSTLEGWLTMNAVAGFTKVFTVKNAISWDVHIQGDSNCPDLDLAVFLDGKAGQPKDGIAQWQEIITRSDMDFDAYMSEYGSGYYAYCADADSNEAIKFINPPDGDYIVKVLGFTVTSAPGHFDLETRTIFSGIEGYELISADPDNPDEDPSLSAYLSNQAVPELDVRTFKVCWSFFWNTSDGVYNGIFTFGVPEARSLISLPIDINLDRTGPNFNELRPSPSEITENCQPVIFIGFSVSDLTELDPISPMLVLDGEDVSSRMVVSTPVSKKYGTSGQQGRWSGTAQFQPPTKLLNGVHNIWFSVADIAGNAAETQWSFQVKTQPRIHHVPEVMTNVNYATPINAVCESDFDVKSVSLKYIGVGQGIYQTIPMTKSGTNTFYGQIPAQGSTGYVQYYLIIEDIYGNTAFSPPMGAEFTPYMLKVNKFGTPVISHEPVAYASELGWVIIPMSSAPIISDDVGVESAFLCYKYEGQENFTRISLYDLPGHMFFNNTQFEQAANISYYFVATDQDNNTVTHPIDISEPHHIEYYPATIAGGDLRVAMQDDIKSLNPLVATDTWSHMILDRIYDTPMNTNPRTDEIIPYIAVGSANYSHKTQGWTWDDCSIGNFGFNPKDTWTGNTKIGEAVIFYDFTNVKWHDGHQMDIRDIMFSMHMAGQVPDWSSSMNVLKDLGGKAGSNYSTDSWLHVYKVYESPDKLQAALKFELQEPYAGFFRDTLDVTLFPEHIWAYKTSGQNVNGARIWCDPGYDINSPDSWKVLPAYEYQNNPPIGSGIFRFDYWNIGISSKMSTFRDHFWRSDYKYTDYVLDEYGNTMAVQPSIDSVTFKIYKTADAAVLALKSSNVDYISWSIPPSYVSELSQEDGISIQESPENGFFYLAYNMRKTSFGYKDGDPMMGDIGKPFRRAVANCIDKNWIVTRLLQNYGIAGEGPVSSLSPWYNKTIPRYAFDPDHGKNILADAGYKVKKTDGTIVVGDAAKAAAGDGNWWINPDGTNIGSSAGGKIEILTPEANYDPIRAQAGLMIAYQLRAVGIYAECVAMDYGTIVDRIENRDFDMYILGWTIGSDPTDYLWSFFHSCNSDLGQNYPGYQNTSFDSVIDAARRSGDEDERKNLVHKAQSSICYDLPYDVLYYRTNIEAYRSDRFTGWEVDSTGSIFNMNSLIRIRMPWEAPPSTSIPERNSGGILKVAIKGQPGPINPLLDCDENTQAVTDLVFDSLARIDPGTLEPKPWIAKSWQVTEEKVLVELRRDVRWHDGRLLEASDVKYTFDYHGLPYISSITILGNWTLEFNLAYPSALFFSEAMLMKLVPSGYTAASEENGCGPFKLISTNSTATVLESFDSYFNPGVNIDGVEFRYYPYMVADWSVDYPISWCYGEDPRYDGTYRASYDLIKGKIDFIGWDLYTANISCNIEVDGNHTTLIQNVATKVVKGSGLEYWYMGLNNAPGHILSDELLRRAISFGMNKEALTVYDISGGLEKADSFITPFNIPFHNASIEQKQSEIQVANAILDSAGFMDRDGDGWRDLPDHPHEPFQLTLLGPTINDVTFYTMSTNIVTWLRQIGLNVALAPMDEISIRQLVDDDNYDMYMGTLKTGIDPKFMDGLYHSDGIAAGTNLWNFAGKQSVDNYSLSGRFTGSPEMTALLEHTNLESAQVYLNGLLLPESYYTLDMENGIISMPHNSTQDGLTISYIFRPLDHYLERSEKQILPEDRARCIKDAQTAIAEQMPSVPLFSFKINNAYNRRYAGWQNMLGGIDNFWSYLNVYPTFDPSEIEAPQSLHAFTSENASWNRLTWAASDYRGGFSGYTIYRSETSGGPYSTIGSVGEVTTYLDTDLAPSTTYYYVVTTDAPNSSYSNEASVANGVAPRVRNLDKGIWYSTVQAAVDDASPGNHIWVTAGTYNERVTVNVLGLNISGEGPATTFIDGGGSGDVMVITASGAIIRGLTVMNGGTSSTDAGIRINPGVDGCIIQGNAIKSNKRGIYVLGSGRNEIFNNTISDNWAGLNLCSDSHNNTATNNTIKFNYHGVLIEGSGCDMNVITFCNIQNNTYHGISFVNYDALPSIGNEIAYNNIVSNGNTGISLWWNLQSNRMHHNNLANNSARNAYDESGLNSWDDGYPSGGNFWNDYVGIDVYAGPSQSIPGSDGFGDTPYTGMRGGASSQDNYPFISYIPDCGIQPTDDVKPPKHSAESPPINGVSANLTPVISVDVTDISGVNETTIKLYISAFQVVKSLTPITNGYRVSYWHEGGFTDGQNVSCRIIAKDILGNTLDFTWYFTARSLSTFEIPIHEGWNLVSVPLTQDQPLVENVLSSIDGKWDVVKYYDGQTKIWKTYRMGGTSNTLSGIDHTMGFWLHALQNTTLTVYGIQPSTTQIALWAGWNLVGYPTLNNSRTVSNALFGTGYTIAEGFSPVYPYISSLEDFDIMKPGEGYWVYVPADTVWQINN
jgi:parallel beta-helix repeat protein